MISKITKKLGKDSNLKELLTGSAVTFVLKITGMGLGYVVYFYITSLYGANGVGIYSLILSVLTLMAMISSFGLNFSILRYAGEFNKKGEQQKLKQLYNYSTRLVLPASVILSLVLFLAAETIALSVFGNLSYKMGLKIAAIALPFLSLTTINVEFIRGLKVLKVSEYLPAVNRPIINLLFMFVFGSMVMSNLLPVYTLVAAIILTYVLSLIYIWIKTRMIKINSNTGFTQKELIKTSLPMMVTTIVSYLLANMSLYFIEIYYASDQVGLYSIALKLSLVVSLVLNVVNTISAPKFSELYWSGKTKELQALVHQSSKLIFYVSFVAVLFLTIFTDVILNMFGEEFLLAKYTFWFLISGQMINAMTGSVGIFLNMTGRQIVLRNIIIVVFIMAFLMNLILIPKFGILGAGFVALFSSASLNISLVIYTHQKLNFTTFYLPFISKMLIYAKH